MMKKIGQYYAAIFKKFGILIPVLGIAAAFVIVILMDTNDVFSSMKPWLFITLVCIGCAAVIAGGVFVYLKIKTPQVGVLDLCLFAVSALALLMLIMFIFTKGTGYIAVLKWTIMSVVLVAGLVLSFFRVKNVQ